MDGFRRDTVSDGIIHIRCIHPNMVARSVEDICAYRRCPLAYTLGGLVGEDGITSERCLEICIREAIHEAGNKRILGEKVLLEAKQDAVGRRLVAFADANGFMAVTGKTYKALIEHERKVELPKDKTELVALIRDIGEYGRLSGVNYPKLRSEILSGKADPRIAAKADMVTVDRVYLRKRDTLLRRRSYLSKQPIEQIHDIHTLV